MRALAGLKDDQTGWLPGHEHGKLVSRELFAELNLFRSNGTMNLESILCQIHPNHHIPHSAVFLLVWR
jgi:hypothetical protein